MSTLCKHIFNIKSCSLTVTKFLITSGSPKSKAVKSEVIDLGQSGNKQCPDWPNFPSIVEGATGSLISGKPTICGGSYPYTDICFVILNSESQFLTNMKTTREFAASSQQEDYLWISGGYDGDNFLSSTEKIHSDGRAIPGPEMPLPLRLHAMVKINENLTLIIGGRSPGNSASKRTFYYNHKTSEWSDGPELKVGRRYLAAGIVTDDVTKEEFVVVSGGYDGSNSLKSTVVLMDDKWTLGKNEIPLKIF